MNKVAYNAGVGSSTDGELQGLRDVIAVVAEKQAQLREAQYAAEDAQLMLVRTLLKRGDAEYLVKPNHAAVWRLLKQG